ncbi:WD40-repeat-containing domain protein [Pyronema domesticum]|uniref:Similar to SVP1-like protein 2 acc. no. Q5B464 n=1 Tax=Pyronema omphalodes (strain CBS 100304) TaxID=1076935 RepID=U4LJS4_PYROM|nr:WD40-repeat-containing domain protein [Pyronema domesticum]CCX32324.1 Similar to SVP1-like protein 2; acc. no. Q5B464 [Pyronema omphalodes CBS 100304]
MNTRPQLATADRRIALCANFNQDSTCFSVGVDNGFHIYSSDPCELQVTRELGGGIAVAAMLGRANFLALVGGGRDPKYAQNKVIIWDDAKKKAVISLEFHSAVRQVRLTRTRIIVVLIGHVHVYQFSSPPTRQHVFDTYDNPLGLVAISARTLVFPGRTPGHVQLCDLASGNISIIPAHTSPLAALCISPQGDLIATASEKGTIIRLYSTDTCSLITEFRRGMDKAVVYSLAISPNSQKLAVTSDKHTLHIFELPTRPHSSPRFSNPQDQHHVNGENKRWSLLGRLPLLPKYFSSEWSACHAEFEGGGVANIGWVAEDTVVVVSIGGGKDGLGEARWEKFVLVEAMNGNGEEVVREGWRRYLDND